MIFWALIAFISMLVFYDVLKTIGDACEYKIISIDENILVLTKWPFYKKHYVYKRDPLANMPWVSVNNIYDRPKSFLLTNALKKYKDQKNEI